MGRCRLIDGSQCPPVVGMVMMGRLCVREQAPREISVLPLDVAMNLKRL